MNDMKECPFCYNKRITYFNGWKFGDRDDEDGRSPSIICDGERGCGIRFTTGYYGRDISDESAKERMIKYWNNRGTI